VFIGLLLEQFSEKKKYKNVRHFRRCKWRKFFGEWFVIVGVFIEAVTGGFLAIDDFITFIIASDSTNKPNFNLNLH